MLSFVLLAVLQTLETGGFWFGVVVAVFAAAAAAAWLLEGGMQDSTRELRSVNARSPLGSSETRGRPRGSKKKSEATKSCQFALLVVPVSIGPSKKVLGDSSLKRWDNDFYL